MVLQKKKINQALHIEDLRTHVLNSNKNKGALRLIGRKVLHRNLLKAFFFFFNQTNLLLKSIFTKLSDIKKQTNKNLSWQLYK